MAAPGLGGPPLVPPPRLADQPPVTVEDQPAVVAPEPASPPPPAPAPQVAAPPAGNALRIVSSLPRSGQDKPLTDTMINALRMALTEHNNQVLGRQIEYVDMDGATP